MLIGNVSVRPVMNASGAQGQVGEGYPHHRSLKRLGLTFDGCAFNSKTFTFLKREGNMPFTEDGMTPQERMPRCIIVKPLQGVALNAVNLSNCGLEAALNDGRLQERTEPFSISLTSAAGTFNDRMNELAQSADLVRKRKKEFRALFIAEYNPTCPNTGSDPAEHAHEFGQGLEVLSAAEVPVQIKLNATITPRAALRICQHPKCAGLVMSNSIFWGMLPDKIKWKDLFGSTTSPLARRGFGKGALSGWPLLPIVCEWIHEFRLLGFSKPIWACGGIDSKRAVKRAYRAGASGVQLGVVAILYPWLMSGIINYANRRFM